MKKRLQKLCVRLVRLITTALVASDLAAVLVLVFTPEPSWRLGVFCIVLTIIATGTQISLELREANKQRLASLAAVSGMMDKWQEKQQ